MTSQRQAGQNVIQTGKKKPYKYIENELTDEEVEGKNKIKEKLVILILSRKIIG